MIYALDTNAVIEIINKNASVCARRDAVIERGGELIIPVVVDYEIRRGFYYRPAPTKEKLYLSLSNCCSICETTNAVWKRGARIYADLRKRGRTVDDADILIAATSVENGYTLVTRNVGHFDGIAGLLMEDWQT